MSKQRDIALPISVLHESFRLCEQTGDLWWQVRPNYHFRDAAVAARWNSRWSGKQAFTADNGKGYGATILSIRDARYRLAQHRCVFAIANGRWPKFIVDHIDGDPSNNQPSNLRDVNGSQNGRNRRLSTANRSGKTGVYWFKPRSNWVAKITVDGRVINLGYFHRFEDAVSARKSAEAEYGFTLRGEAFG